MSNALRKALAIEACCAEIQSLKSKRIIAVTSICKKYDLDPNKIFKLMGSHIYRK